jgi:hypothetical protein
MQTSILRTLAYVYVAVALAPLALMSMWFVFGLVAIDAGAEPSTGNKSNRSEWSSTTQSPGWVTTQAALVCCYSRRWHHYEWRTASCQLNKLADWIKVQPERCSDETAQACCRYSTPFASQPSYKWDTPATCRGSKGVLVDVKKCIAVNR